MTTREADRLGVTALRRATRARVIRLPRTTLLLLLLATLTPPGALAQSPGTWISTGSLARGHFQGASVLLADGRVLVSGGRDGSGVATDAVEIYDPATGLWSSGGSMLSARAAHTATRVAGGKVLFAGGDGAGTAELFDPALGTSAAVGSVGSSLGTHTATLLDDGRVLIA